MHRGILGIAALTATIALAEPNLALEQARKRYEALDFAGAAAELGRAWNHEGNDRATTVEILKLQGIVAGQLKKADQSRAFFLQALTLDATARLNGSYPPRVKTPFFEALGIVEEQGTLSVAPAPVERKDAKVHSVGLVVSKDPLRQVRSVRLHLKKDTLWETQTLPAAGPLNAVVDAPRVEWWAEVLGEHDAVLVQLGSAAKPMLEAPVDVPVAVAPPPPPPMPPLEVVQPPVAHGPTPLRLTGYVLGGTAVASVAVGAFFGVRAQNERATFLTATRDQAGVVTSISQRDAFALDAKARADSLVANVLFGSAGGLALTGALLWWLGAEPPVAVAVGPGSVVVSGRFK